MRRHVIIWTMALFALAALAGCGHKTEQAQQATSADSLLASNPTEQQPGDLTPQTPYDQTTQGQQPPAATTTNTTPPPASRPISKPKPKPHTNTTASTEPATRGVTIPAGTDLGVTIGTALTSETAQPGDAWSGTVKDALILGTDAPIPAGSIVHGVVRTSVPAEKGSRAVLVLAITSVEVGGRTHSIDATADSLVAGSTRARNVGAVAGGAAAGAILGKVIGGGKGALIGGLLGAGGTAAAVSKTKGYQSVVKEGQELTFHVDHSTTFHLDQTTATR
jgi:hypothetical protein